MSESSHDPMYTEGGITAFRCFAYQPDSGDGYLSSLVSSYTWQPGEQEADAVPTHSNTNGFYAFKTLAEAIYQEGSWDEHIFALTEHWGKMVEGENGLRSQFAEVVAFIEPVRPKQLAIFPREYLAEKYPDVPVIRQTEIAARIEELGMVSLPRAEPYPLMQWLGPGSQLVWAHEGLGPTVSGDDEYEMLPAAVSYPDETHPADERLRKVRMQPPGGDTYIFWDLVGAETGAYRGLLYSPARDLYRHRVQDR